MYSSITTTASFTNLFVSTPFTALDMVEEQKVMNGGKKLN
jgi:hypothetical protein